MPFVPAQSIDEVLQQLDQIIADSIDQASLLGAFAALYRQVTARVKQGIADGRFEDGARMERLDVVFANRYLAAYAQYKAAGEFPTQSWLLAFEKTRLPELLIIQHLFLGMNAHINLDLGIAAAEIAPGESIHELEKDFMEINQLLLEMVGAVQKRIGELSPLFWLLDWLGGVSDERLAGFSLKAARDQAWRMACRLAPMSADQRSEEIPEVDAGVLLLAELIARPPGFFHSKLFRLVKWLEETDPQKIVRALQRPF